MAGENLRHGGGGRDGSVWPVDGPQQSDLHGYQRLLLHVMLHQLRYRIEVLLLCFHLNRLVSSVK